MKIDKKKIVFVSIIVVVLIFILSYTILVFMEEEAPAILEQPLVPELKEEQKEYTSKIDALDDLKEERERIIPSVYADNLLDSLDAYAPAIEEGEGDWIADSIFYSDPEIVYRQGVNPHGRVEASPVQEETEGLPTQSVVAKKDLSAGHATFFLSGISLQNNQDRKIVQEFTAEIHGTQTIRTGDRLELILTEEAHINGEIFRKNTLVYGFTSIKHNRLDIKITHIGGKEIHLKAFDFQDSNEGIYVENSFSAEAGREVLDDLVQDISVAGLPQIGGIKNIFRRNNKKIKITVLDQYQLILKTKQ